MTHEYMTPYIWSIQVVPSDGTCLITEKGMSHSNHNNGSDDVLLPQTSAAPAIKSATPVAPLTPMATQEWMAAQLNRLSWTKLDIDCRHTPCIPMQGLL